jgi:hypothetical protein
VGGGKGSNDGDSNHVNSKVEKTIKINQITHYIPLHLAVQTAFANGENVAMDLIVEHFVSFVSGGRNHGCKFNLNFIIDESLNQKTCNGSESPEHGARTSR